MFVIEHYVGPSKIHGVGVFAAELIAKGDLIWQLDARLDVIIPDNALSEYPLSVQRRIVERAEYRERERIYILATDGDGYMNHSEMPNFEDHGDFALAGRDIAVGEEITCDYRRSGVRMDFSVNKPPLGE